MFDPHTDELPPPSYELSQETFDQKTSQGIQASLEPQPDTLDLWEEWDEAKFTTNARALPETPASSSSSSVPPPPPLTAQQYPQEKAPRPAPPPPPPQEEPAVRPLRIVKKSAERSQAAAYKKAAEASSYQSNTHPGGPACSSDEGAALGRSFSVLSAGRRTPPPVFESVGPSYDGPDYDEVAISYVPGDSRPSSPMSVLSNDSYRLPVPPPPRMTDPRPNTVMPPPPPPPIRYQPAQRPTSTQAQRPQYQQQPRRRVGFDPMSAYNKPKTTFTPHLDPTPERIDPSAFYNSAVSAHLSPIPQRSTITPTYRAGGMYQQEMQHPRPHHAATFDSFGSLGSMGNVNMGMNMGRERAMSVISTDSSYYPNPPMNLSPNRGWAHQGQSYNPGR